MTDLITSLRALAAARHDDLSIAVDAVIEIERQRAEIERLHRAHDVACEGGERLHAKYNQLRFEIERLLQAFGLLTTTVPDMEIDIENAAGMAQRVMAKVDRQRTEIERLREALRWYADKENYKPRDFAAREVFIDAGERARNALEGKP